MVRTCLEDPRLEDHAEPPSLRAAALGRLIRIYFRDVARQKTNGSFSSRRRRERTSFCDRFHDFARAYFLLAQSREDLFRVGMAEFQEAPAEMLAQVLKAAVASDQLAPLPVPARAAAALIGINLVTLQQQVGTGQKGDAPTLTPTEAADLLTTVLFEGVQVSSPLHAPSSEEIDSSRVKPQPAAPAGGRSALRRSGAPRRPAAGGWRCSIRRKIEES